MTRPASAIREVEVEANGLRFHTLQAGEGPLVLLYHGFPEIAHCWRHQIDALARAGYYAVAPDLRGYGRTDAPQDIESYTILHLVGDPVGLVHALGRTSCVLIGHDWGSALTWNAALLRPDVFTRIVGISVPYQPRRPGRRPVETFNAITKSKGLDPFYMVRFQQPGVAEAEYEADIERSLRIIMHSLDGATPKAQQFQSFVADGEPLLGHYQDKATLPVWMTLEDFAVFVEAFERSGFRGPLNWYRNLDRNWDLMAAFEGQTIDQPALYITGERDHVRDFAGSFERDLAKNVPGLSQIVEVEEAGHWVHQEAPVAINDALSSFLERTNTVSP